MHLAEQRPLDGYLLHVRRLRQLELLHGGRVLGRREVHVVPVDVDVERLGRRRARGCAQEDGVQFDLGREAVGYVSWRLANPILFVSVM